MKISGVVHKFILDKLYGFALDSKGQQYFFHLCDFNKADFTHQPPPIIGEPVEIEVGRSGSTEINKAVKAISVTRVKDPAFIIGHIEYYDEINTYGFIRDSENTAYYLHKSEILDKATAKKGQKVKFYAGINKGKPRACYVTFIK